MARDRSAPRVPVRTRDALGRCHNARMSRTRSLRALLIAITVAGVSLPHLIAGEVAGSLPSLVIGILVGLGCLALGGRSRAARAMTTLGIAVVALAPLVAYLAQEAAEHESGLETAHAEPSLFAAIAIQAPLIILALIAVRLLAVVVKTVVRALTRGIAEPRPARASSVRTPTLAVLLPFRLALLSSNGQRAPPMVVAPRRLAPPD